MPSPDPVLVVLERTTSTFSAASAGSGSRPPAAPDTSTSTPLRVALLMSAAQSTKVVAPGSAQRNVMVLTAEKSSPSSSPVRSTSMS
jgi:hypothetical protein